MTSHHSHCARWQHVLLLLAAVIAFTPGRLCAQTITVPTVADAGTEGVYFARICPAHDVALADPSEADVFSIYTVKGVPYLLKLRVRPAGYVVKKGEHVVVKTTEAKSLTFEHVTGQRSGIRDAADDNIVSPAADTPTADFIAANAVAGGQYLYLLTNMVSNGGFGFTHFTGDIMRRGQFFIISSRKPESVSATTRAFEALEDGSTVPFLAGEAGNDDGFVQTAYAQGDANGDGAVDVADVVETVNQIQGSPSSRFIFDAADMNKDRDVNADDVIQIVNAIMSSK